MNKSTQIFMDFILQNNKLERDFRSYANNVIKDMDERTKQIIIENDVIIKTTALADLHVYINKYFFDLYDGLSDSTDKFNIMIARIASINIDFKEIANEFIKDAICNE